VAHPHPERAGTALTPMAHDGAAAGVIIATIMTAHITASVATSIQPHSYISVIAMPGMSSMDIADIVDARWTR